MGWGIKNTVKNTGNAYVLIQKNVHGLLYNLKHTQKSCIHVSHI